MMSKTIRVHELDEQLRTGRIERLWNVQTELLFEGDTIPGSEHVPLDRLRSKMTVTPTRASSVIVVYSGGPECLQGKLAAGILTTLGYNEARSLTGGLHAWRAAGLPVTPPRRPATNPQPPRAQRASAEAPPAASVTALDEIRHDELSELLEGVLVGARRFALRLSANEADADDLVQEAALRACRFFHQFTPGSNFRAWFYRILTNCFYRSLRSKNRRAAQMSFDDTPALSLSQIVDLQATDPARALISGLDSEEIVAALGELPRDFRTVALLYFLEDLSYQQIANTLSVPIGTVRSRLHRARRLLQEELWEVAAEHGLVHTN